MPSSDDFRVICETYDPNGRERLVLQLMRVSDAPNARNSNALIWESRSASGWSESLVFSRAELQGSFPRRRWAAGIARFDALSAQAIIMVGELSEPDCEGLEQPKYSWWECDIRNKRLIRRIKDCDDPTEEYGDAEGKTPRAT
jgi:hypothetical protein